MARIFVAANPADATAIERIMASGHELTFVNIMSMAVDKLKVEEFDLIMIGVHFDESRMFDLLRDIPKIPANANKPTICFCMRDTPVVRQMYDSIYFTSRILGAWMYLDQHKYSDTKQPDAEMRRIIERCLTDEARKETQAIRLDIHKQREELLRHRLALDDREWSVDLEDRLASLREKLAKVLLELSESQIESISQQEVIAESKKLEDRVSQPVKMEEQAMRLAEKEMGRQESAQLGKEQGVVPGEEAKAKEGRHKQSSSEPDSKLPL